jgi:hypothetical protein
MIQESHNFKHSMINIFCGIIGFFTVISIKTPTFFIVYLFLNDSFDYNYSPDNYLLDFFIMSFGFWVIRRIIYKIIQEPKSTIVYKDGSQYIGTTILYTEIRNGRGVAQWKNGYKYIGDFNYNYRTGNGLFYLSNGNHFEGKFLKNEFNGYGTYYFADGGQVSGMYKNGKLIDEY